MTSMFSIFRFALAHKLIHSRLPLAPSIKTSQPAPQHPYPKPQLSLFFFFFHLSDYLNMMWRLGGFQRISFWQNKIWKSNTCMYKFYLKNVHRCSFQTFFSKLLRSPHHLVEIVKTFPFFFPYVSLS